MWYIIIAILVFVLGKFFYERYQQSQQVLKEGGMLHKYQKLVDLLLSGHSNTKIYQVTSESIVLGSGSAGGSTIFYLAQTWGKITIQWKVESPIFGNHKLEWSFHEYDDQGKMVEKISTDLMHYQNNVMTAQGFPRIDE
jgi:hypothetical protein